MSGFDKKLLLLYEELPEDMIPNYDKYAKPHYITIDATESIVITLPSIVSNQTITIRNTGNSQVIIQMPHEVMYDE